MWSRNCDGAVGRDGKTPGPTLNTHCQQNQMLQPSSNCQTSTETNEKGSTAPANNT